MIFNEMMRSALC